MIGAEGETRRDGRGESIELIAPDLNLLDLCGEQGHGGQRGRTDGEALAGGGRGIAEHVEGVGAFADVRRQGGHLGVAAGIVGDGAVGVGGERDSECGEHADRGESDAVEAVDRALGETACEGEGADDRADRGDDRDGGGKHAERKTVDNGGGGSHLRLGGEFLGGAVFVGGVILGAVADDDAGEKSGDDRAEDAPAEEPGENEDGAGDEDQDGTAPGAQTERAKQRAHARAFLAADRENADE